MDERQRRLGLKHQDTLKAVEDLGLTLQKLEAFEEAEELQRENLKRFQEELQNQKMGMLRSRHTLAMTLQRLGRLDEAEELQGKTLEMFQQLLGDEHPLSSRAKLRLASTLHLRNGNAEAIGFQKEVVSVYLKDLGANASDTEEAVKELRSSLKTLGKSDLEISVEIKALAGKSSSTKEKQQLGSGHVFLSGRFTSPKNLDYMSRVKSVLEEQHGVKTYMVECVASDDFA